MTSQNAPQQGSHHWILTLQIPGEVTVTDSGTWTPPAGATRYDVFAAIRTYVIAQHPPLSRANTLFFSLEPNQL
ncbi:hypothetical protein [Streptomyces lavendulae]|uniref:hypothetical protein n=1 Tax=Streptomyces lavendulae TaxID=1914 RepID=UPI0024A21821|nr:hypothetical protein [Streptomyces lavendulae]GLW00303.1 hypothetical protein Slala05_39340 [Streptomyces lavendulae subsp. lavendulae]